ncbi:MAG: Smr/MutS family protein [Bdellovibrionales bacterium]
MTDNKETDSKKGLSKGDVDLWREVTKDVDLLKDRDYLSVEEDTLDEFHNRALRKDIVSPNDSLGQINDLKPHKPNLKSGTELDRQTMKRLQKGDIPIEARLDLHGYNQGQAREALIRFILSAHQSGKRCVLVVTGKGNSGRKGQDWLDKKPGVLKQNVPIWLRESELSGIVLQVVPAKGKHGGDGALYVYLRRKRA